MGDRENIEQVKSEGSSEISSLMEGVYNRVWQLRKRGKFGKYERSSSRVQREGKCRSKEIGKVRHSRRKRL